MEKFLKEKMKDAGFELSEKQTRKFMDYYELLIAWNEKMNLTAITEFEDVVIKHFVDSVMIGKKFLWDENLTLRIMDLGTGAGFPGIPIKIMYPGMQVLLMDSLNKRIRFLDEVIVRLSLEKVSTLHARAEESGRKEEYREQYDICVSRAVAQLSSLAEFCLPFVKKGGCFISYKGGNVEEELQNAKKAIAVLGGKTGRIEKFVLPGSDMERSLICIEKVKETPKKYPRQGGKPLKEPL